MISHTRMFRLVQLTEKQEKAVDVFKSEMLERYTGQFEAAWFVLYYIILPIYYFTSSGPKTPTLADGVIYKNR